MRLAGKALILACGIFTISHNSYASTNEEKHLNYGVLSSKPKKRIKDSYPLFSYVAEQLSHHGYTDAQIKVYTSIDELISAIQLGDVDLISSTIYPTLIIKEKSPIEPALVRWKKGQSSYSSIFVTNKDNGYKNLSDLQGKVVGFEDRGSTSGYFLPMVSLIEQGLKVQHLTSLQEKPDADKVGYVFFDDLLRETNEVNMTLWVARGMVDAIAYSSSNWDNPKDTPIALKQKLYTFAQTQDYPRSIISISHSLDPTVAADLKRTLLELDTNVHGLGLLNQYQKTKKFTAFDSQTEKQLYDAQTLIHILDTTQ
ncbi:phosphate/phosphite/phosphonate ABC transporter substrate-binding protein [Vibrio aquaticus]|uniref:Phosphate/phosphite/phosphonate ABC transporter substrate-binding protein n=1 Tax=Vibrio aquaticus TaxID=2496559 RepID=A0A3S0V3X0_9VIBR|nr:phosphate/phosphite/phosphonate ABC transporter substrate-binding protein [Vibrio aquaticus]